MAMTRNQRSAFCDTRNSRSRKAIRRAENGFYSPSSRGKPIHVRYTTPYGWKLKSCYLVLENLSAIACMTQPDQGSRSVDLTSHAAKDKQSGLLSPDTAVALLAWNQKFGDPIICCKNRLRGCRVKLYWRLTLLHEECCPYPNVLNHTVNAKLNVSLAPTKFGVFCHSYSNIADVLFLYRQAGDVIKVRAMHYSGASRFFKMRFTNGKYIHDISGHTGVLAIFSLPQDVMCPTSNLLSYSIELKV